MVQKFDRNATTRMVHTRCQETRWCWSMINLGQQNGPQNMLGDQMVMEYDEPGEKPKYSCKMPGQKVQQSVLREISGVDILVHIACSKNNPIPF